MRKQGDTREYDTFVKGTPIFGKCFGSLLIMQQMWNRIKTENLLQKTHQIMTFDSQIYVKTYNEND